MDEDKAKRNRVRSHYKAQEKGGIEVSIKLTDKEMKWLERRIDSHHDKKIDISEDDHYIITELLPRLIYEVRWSRDKIENDRVFISGLLLR